MAEPLGFGQLVAEEVAAPDGGAAAKARAIARPKPWAAPVTMTVLPPKWMFMVLFL